MSGPGFEYGALLPSNLFALERLHSYAAQTTAELKSLRVLWGGRLQYVLSESSVDIHGTNSV
jgi:hypothetical protein